MDINWVKEQVKALQLDKGIDLADIPDIDLYMDQLITLFENKLSHTKRYEEDKLLTKTMINNYTKDKVIMPATKKKYTKEHIMLMVLLYQFKSVTSIGDIKEVFSLLRDEEDKINRDKLMSLYDAYQICKRKEEAAFETAMEERVEILNEELTLAGIEDEAIETDILIFTLLEQANYHKRLAERIIDERIKKRQQS